MQTISGTGALYLGALFLDRNIESSKPETVYVSDPPYVNHTPILQNASLSTELYPYYSKQTKSIEIDRLLARLDSIPSRSVVLLHACAHNPTGVDPSREQWKQIAATMKAKSHIPFFDSAYQGFASGSLDDDAWAIRYFVEQGFEAVMIAQSYAKNFGLYGELYGRIRHIDLSVHVERHANSRKSRRASWLSAHCCRKLRPRHSNSQSTAEVAAGDYLYTTSIRSTNSLVGA